jgi:hypothetical protein
MLKEESMAMPYKQHQQMVTRRWYRYYSMIEGRTSALKEDSTAIPYKQHQLVVTIRWCRYFSIEGRMSNAQGEYGSALQAVSRKGHEKVVQMLRGYMSPH